LYTVGYVGGDGVWANFQPPPEQKKKKKEMKIDRVAFSFLVLLAPLAQCAPVMNTDQHHLMSRKDVQMMQPLIFEQLEEKKKRRLQGPDGGGQQGQGGEGQGGQQGQGQQGGEGQGQQGNQQAQGPEGQQNNQGPEGQQNNNQQGQQNNNQQGQQQQGPEGENQQNNNNQQGPEGENQQNNNNQQGPEGENQQNNNNQQGPEGENQQNNNNQQQGPEGENQQQEGPEDQQNQQQGPEDQQKDQDQKDQEQQEQEQKEQEQREQEQKEQEQKEQEQKEQEQKEQEQKDQQEGQIDCVKYPWRCPIPTPAPTPYQANPNYLRPTAKPTSTFGSSSESSGLVSNTNLAQDAEIGFVIGVGVVVAALFFGIALVAYRAKVHVGVARRVRNYLHNRDGGEGMSVLEVALAMLEGGDEKPPRRNFDVSSPSPPSLDAC
jgi:hypothetical protein